jgi:predicted Mrr-cat superfamily restriction endonuclease
MTLHSKVSTLCFIRMNNNYESINMKEYLNNINYKINNNMTFKNNLLIIYNKEDQLKLHQPILTLNIYNDNIFTKITFSF